MPPARTGPPLYEPLGRTLARNVAIALAVGAGFAAASRRLRLLLPASILALWFSLGGHYVEVFFLKGLRPRTDEGSRWQRGQVSGSLADASCTC